jgi:putative oxidoreductase
MISRRRLVFPALAGLYELFAPFSYAFIRFSTGIILLPHGVSKLLSGDLTQLADGIARHGLPSPALLAGLAVFAESVGAAFLAVGFLTRIAAATIWIEMAVIIGLYQWPNGYFWTDKGYEFPLLWLLLCTAIFFRGGGRYSVDHLIGKEF